jgi:hypothetical protein
MPACYPRSVARGAGASVTHIRRDERSAADEEQSVIWLPLLDSQQYVIRLDAEEPRQERLLVVGQASMPLPLGFQLALE